VIDVVKTEQFVKNGVDYTRTYFGEDEDNITGILEKPTNEPEYAEPKMTEEEENALETSINVEYLVCLADLNV